MLKTGDYEMWRLRIEQYFQLQDYALWDVIENGNSFKPVAHTTTNDAENGISFKPVAHTTTNDAGTSTTLIPGPVTTEKKSQKKNDVKARNLSSRSFPEGFVLLTSIACSSTKSSSSKGDVLGGGGVSSNVTFKDSSTLLFVC
nr:ribonuclease H-like domain-containing protein [Tanacetum cinerariifolium]